MRFPAIVILVILAVGVLFVLLPLAAYTFRRSRHALSLRCPETGERARLDIDAVRAALTAALGRPRKRVGWCSLWADRKGCGRGWVGAGPGQGQGRPAARRMLQGDVERRWPRAVVFFRAPRAL